MAKAIALRQKKRRITLKDILCLPANLIIKWANIINPKNIMNNYVKMIRENKVAFFITLAFILFLGMRIAFMDFDLSSLGISNSMLCGGNSDEVVERLTVSDKLEGDGIEALYTTMKPIGIALSVLWWLLMLVSLSVRDQFTVEQVAMHFIRLILPVYLINDLGFDLMKKILEVGESIATDVASSWKVTLDEVNAGDMKVSLFNIINALIPLLVLWVIGLACKLICILTCLMRRIKLELLVAFAPIALSDVTGDAHSTSVRYCKNLLATALQGALILGLGYISMQVLTSFIGGDIDKVDSLSKQICDGSRSLIDCVPCIAVALTVIGLMPKTEDIAKTIVGS